eukprot:COSAG02_NODE_629_length_19328_cov_24.710333_9_plen_569_part_00
MSPLRTIRALRAARSIAQRPPRRQVHASDVSLARSEAQRLDFRDNALAYQSLSNRDLLRAVGVFSACGCAPLVRNAEALLAGATRVLGSRAVELIVRPTFFQHFCVGEDVQDIAPVLARLRSAGIGGILDYAAEADLADEDFGIDDNRDPGRITFETHGVSSPPVYSARVYHYTNERECDANEQIFRQAIEAVRDVSPDGFAAIKMTALGNPMLLERWSTALVEIAGLFDRIQGESASEHGMDWPTFLKGYQSLFHVPDEAGLRRAFDRHAGDDGRLDALEWCAALDVQQMAAMAAHCRSRGPFTRAALDEGEQALVTRMIERVQGLAALADHHAVRLMIDAEHSYFQPAIDQLVLDLQRKYNRQDRGKQPIIFNTYQCYLKAATSKISAHIALAEREGWHFAAKLVRGAYMELEATHAVALGQESPIHPTIDATHDCYNGAISTILRRPAVTNGESRPNLMVASHNQGSIEHTLSEMAENGITRDADGGVAFGQLYGMADHLTFTLGAHGYQAYKYVPYGPLHEVLPYLVRRAQENAGMLQNSGNERAMLWGELVRRVRMRLQGQVK